MVVVAREEVPRSSGERLKVCCCQSKRLHGRLQAAAFYSVTSVRILSSSFRTMATIFSKHPWWACGYAACSAMCLPSARRGRGP